MSNAIMISNYSDYMQYQILLQHPELIKVGVIISFVIMAIVALITLVGFIRIMRR